jgi:HEAT repeat protein
MAVEPTGDPFVTSAEAMRRASSRDPAGEDASPASRIATQLRTIVDLLRDTTGDPLERTRAAALMIASLPPASRDVAEVELHELASLLPPEAVDELRRAPSPHVRAGVRRIDQLCDTARRGRPAPPLAPDVHSTSAGEEPPPRAGEPDLSGHVSEWTTTAGADVAATLSGLADPDAAVRLDAIGALGEALLDERFVDALIAIATSDPWPDVRDAALARFEMCDRRGRLRLVEAALDAEPDVQLGAIRLVDGSDDDELVLAARYVRSAAAAAASHAIGLLGRAQRAVGIALLWTCLPHDDDARQQQILDRIHAVDGDALGLLARTALTSTDTAQRVVGLAAASCCPGDLDDRVIDALTDPSPVIRLASLCSLERRWIPRAFQAVTDRRLDPRPDVRERAVHLLARSRDGRALTHLLAASADPVEDVRRTAREAIRTMASRDVIARIVGELDRAETATIAEDVLLEIGSDAVPALITSLDDLTHEGRTRAANILRTVGAAPSIRDALAHRDPAVRRRAASAWALTRGTEAVPVLLEMIDDPDPSVRIRIAQLIGETGTGAVADDLALFQLRELDPNVADAIGEARRRLAPTSAGLEPAREAAR